MSKRTREIKSVVEGAGLDLVELSSRGSGHYGAQVRAKDGTERMYVFACSLSDWRGDLNKRSELRRFAREHDRKERAAA